MRGLQLEGGSKQTGVIVSLPDIHGIRVDARPNDKKRFRLSAYVQTFALTYGEEVRAVVRADHCAHVWCQREGCSSLRKRCVGSTDKNLVRAIHFDDVPGLHGQLLLQEVRKPHFANEAQALRILFCRRRQVDFCCDAPDLRLFEFADREEGSSELLLVELAQEIALVFVAVSTCKQMVRPCLIGRLPAVVASRHRLRTQFQCGVEEQVKLDLPVAQHIGIGRSTSRIFCKHVIDNPLFVLGTEVHDLKGNAQMVRHQHGVVGVVNPRTFVVDGDALVVPVSHEQPNHLMTLLQEQVSGDARIHTSGKANNNSHAPKVQASSGVGIAFGMDFPDLNRHRLKCRGNPFGLRASFKRPSSCTKQSCAPTSKLVNSANAGLSASFSSGITV